MSATTEQAIARLDKAEYDLVAALAGIPGAGGMREKALEVLEKVRATKRALLARSPDILRKSSARRAQPQPSWRGLPVDTIAADRLVKEARSRGLEEQRLAKAFGKEPGCQAELATVKVALRQPIAGERAFLGFFSRRAGR